MKPKRCDPAASLVRCTTCGYPLCMVEFWSPEDKRVCADYWSPVEPKKELLTCPQCGAITSKQTVELWPMDDGKSAAARKQVEKQIVTGIFQLPPALQGEVIGLFDRLLKAFRTAGAM